MVKPHILVLDRHPLFRKGLCDVLGEEGYDCEAVDSFDDLMTTLDHGCRPDLILSDLRHTGTTNMASHSYLRINCLRSRFPKQRLMIVNDGDEEGAICSCMALGVSGCVLKSQSGQELKEAVRTVLAGKTYAPPGYEKNANGKRIPPLAQLLRCLTGQESRVLMLVCDGLFNQEIADALGLREATVKAHVSQVLRKLSVPNRTNAVVMMERLAEAAA